MGEWSSVPIASLCDRMKSLCCHTTTKQTNRQEQEFRMALKRSGFAGLGKNIEKKYKGMLAGNRCVRESGQAVGMRWGTRVQR
jgi:hypothetical protein